MGTPDMLWWSMLSTGVAAALLGIVASVLDREGALWPGRRGRFAMHVASYALMSTSILLFAMRGLLTP
jgi:hypothetical protein